MTDALNLQTIARDLRARVLEGKELSAEESAAALAAIRMGRRAAASAGGPTKKSSGSATPRSAAELLGALGVPTQP